MVAGDESWEKRKDVAFENARKEKDYRKDIPQNEIGSETRRKVSRMQLQMNLVFSFLPLLSVSFPHCPSHFHLQKPL